MQFGVAAFVACLMTLPGVRGLGINCRGSGECARDAAAMQLTGYINELDPNSWFDDGEKLACVGRICAFLQGTSGATGAMIQSIAHFIPEHGCLVCGSVPYYYVGGNNDVRYGQLTYNAVALTDSCVGQDGVCRRG